MTQDTLTALPSSVRERIQRKIDTIRMLPAIAMRALEIVNNPECSIGEFAAMVERDVKLASDILSMANSAIFAPTVPIASLHHAVVRLGFRQCKNLIISSSLTALLRQITLDEEWIRELLWRHAFQTAMLGLHLNRALNVGFHGEEFTAGLVHDFGRSLLAASLPEQFNEIDPMEFRESSATIDEERRICGTDHCEVGAWFAAANQLPEDLIDVVRFHHTPEKSAGHLRLTALTAACDHMANHLQRHECAEGYHPDLNRAVQLLEASGVRQAVRSFAEIYPMVMESAARDSTEMMAL